MDAGLLEQMLIGALLALSVYLPLRCGQLSLATPGFFAIGGTVAALLSTRIPSFAGTGATSPLPALLLEMTLGGLLAALLALAIGGTVLRLRGIYLAIATIALVEILRVITLNLSFTGGALGIFGIPSPSPRPAAMPVSRSCCWPWSAGSAPGWSSCAWAGRWRRSATTSWPPPASASTPPR